MAKFFAAAKINLCLHICDRRADGYHLLESLVAFADIGDWLDIEPADHTTLFIEGADQLSSDDNLILSAHRLMDAPPCTFRLQKKLPLAAGLGGGSADAAATLRGLAELYDLPLPVGDMRDMGEKIAALGADIAVCLQQKPAWMSGIGEIVTPLSAFPDADIILVHPAVPLSTKEVFSKITKMNKAPTNMPMAFHDFQTLCDFLTHTRNDLHPPAQELVPEIADIIAQLRESGAQFAAMSGSGATCFGLYKAGTGAAARHHLNLPDHYWVRAGKLMT